MFIGHYAPAILGASTGKIKLWQAFVGAQLVDYGWAALNLAGVEHTTIVPGLTQASALSLDYMPYTHSLGMSVIWACAAAFGFMALFRGQGKAGALVFGLVVLSHWFMDLIVHIPDLTLWFGGEKYGFGLWNNRRFSFSLEVGLLLLAMFLYLRSTKAHSKAGRIWPFVFVGVMIALQYVGNYGETPPSVTMVNITSLVLYTLFALGAWGVDRGRAFKA